MAVQHDKREYLHTLLPNPNKNFGFLVAKTANDTLRKKNFTRDDICTITLSDVLIHVRKCLLKGIGLNSQKYI